MPEGLSDDQWQQAMDLTREKNKQLHQHFMAFLITESLFAYAALGAAVYLVATGRWIGVLIALAATNVPKIRRVGEIVRGWAGLNRPDDELPDS